MASVNAKFSIDTTFFERAANRLTLRTAGKVEKGIKAAIKKVYDISQVLVPVDTGALKQSGDYLFYGSGFNTSGEVFYETYYAGFVHEDWSKHHDYPTQAKYLEDAYRQVRPQMAQIIASGSIGSFVIVEDNFGVNDVTEIL